MKLLKNDFIEILKKEAKKLNIDLTKKQLEQFYLYKELLLEWNNKINLTAITEDDEILFKHFVDSLSIIKLIEKENAVIDIGTGAGFPGIVIAICIEKIKITLLDALNKRIEFLKIIKKELNLDNIILVHARAEEIAITEEYRERFDTVVSRAVAPLNILLEYMTGFVKPDGRIIVMKGKNIKEELIKSKHAEVVLKIKQKYIDKYKIKLNNQLIEHCNIIYKKDDKLSKEYPRPYNKIKKYPL